ncbi:hypothetical protein [Sphingomonas sp.]|uniref:hypothetical protein n=1 Tax=Sphingomonas sp. TaxID=28214 RepID=UPI00257FCE84|nr:hypothetical protein [Sphingomonas sp.]
MNQHLTLLRIHADGAAHISGIDVIAIIVDRARLAGFVPRIVRELGAEPKAPAIVEVVDDDERLRTFATELSRLPGVRFLTLETLHGHAASERMSVSAPLEREE